MNKRKLKVFGVLALLIGGVLSFPAAGTASPHSNGWTAANRDDSRDRVAERPIWWNPGHPNQPPPGYHGGYSYGPGYPVYPPPSESRERFRREVYQLSSETNSLERNLGNRFQGYGASAQLRDLVSQFSREVDHLTSEVSRGLYGGSHVERDLDRIERYADRVDDRLRFEGRNSWRVEEAWNRVRAQLGDTLYAFRNGCEVDPYGFGYEQGYPYRR